MPMMRVRLSILAVLLALVVFAPTTAIVVLVLATTGCATSTPKAVTDLKQIVGPWDGWIGCRECSLRLRASLSIRDGGDWEMVIARNPNYYGKIGIVDGDLRWGVTKRWIGLVTLIEKRGRAYISFMSPDGRGCTTFV